MTIDDAALPGPRTAAASAEVFQQLGQITRQLHDTLTHLGVMTKLQQAAGGLPDARSRLAYIARKTGESADKVLNSVDNAKQEHAHIAEATRGIARSLAADPVGAVASGALMNFVSNVEGATGRIDAHLTDIMLAQDFHDLTGQVVTKVVALASDLEDSLVKLLVQVAPQELVPAQRHAHPAAPAPVTGGTAAALQGPVLDAVGRTDVVADQGEVDDLLASLGF